MHRPISLAILLVLWPPIAHGQQPSPQIPPKSPPVTAPPPPSANPPTQPQAQPPTGGRYVWMPDQPPPPPRTGQWKWVDDQPPEASRSPVGAPPPGYGYGSTYPAYAAPAQFYGLGYGVQPGTSVTTTSQPLTIQFGGGLSSAASTRIGQFFTNLGTKRISVEIKTSRTGQLVGGQTVTYNVNQPTAYYPVAVPPAYQLDRPVHLIGTPPAACLPPPNEAAPPVPAVPHPSAQSPTQGPRRIGLLEGVFGAH